MPTACPRERFTSTPYQTSLTENRARFYNEGGAGVRTGSFRFAWSRSPSSSSLCRLPRAPIRREALYGRASFEVLLDNLGDVGLREAQVPSAPGLRPIVDDDVWAVLAQAEAVDGVDTDVAK